MATISDSMPSTVRWNERAAVFQATRMLMGERKSPERVAEFLANIEPLIEQDPARETVQA